MKEGLNYKYLKTSSLLTAQLRFVLPFIFYAQFGYLYSFAPSSFSKETIDKLVKDSLIRNKAEVISIYDTLKEKTNTFFSAKLMAFMQYDQDSKETTKLGEAKEFRCAVENDSCVI
tara:strand:+ start:83 stop:430 length:348 start_codon:yes stop_codon:yes gene_type:complete